MTSDTREVFSLTSSSLFRSDWGLRDQIRRSCVSIMSNIAEGFERSSPKEFVRFLEFAKGSCGELRAQLYVIEDANFGGYKDLTAMRNEAFEIGRMLYGLSRAIKKGASLGG